MPAGKGTYGDQVGRPPSPNKKSGFKMNGWGGWQEKTGMTDSPMMKSAFREDPPKAVKGEEKKKEGANFMSYEEMINSDKYQKSHKGTEWTHWGTTQDSPDGPEYKKVFKVKKR
tara:strand:- start:1166 stop:1507 length:342 start_codon:yes stop_codon:yes gene_type:complete